MDRQVTIYVRKKESCPIIHLLAIQMFNLFKLWQSNPYVMMKTDDYRNKKLK